MQPSENDHWNARLHSRVPLLGGWLRRQTVQALAQDGSAEAVRLLEATVPRADDRDLGRRALDALEQLAAAENVAAREALCRLFLRHDHVGARRIALKADYAPHEESRRALFFFLTEQWDRYDRLDFEQRYLRAAYDRGDAAVRNRIAAQARRAGRVEWVALASGGKQGRRLGTMTDPEWQAALAVLAEGQRWGELWQLAQEAPPRWSARLLTELFRSRWQPAAHDVAGFMELVKLARAWPPLDFRGCFRHFDTLHGHTDDVRALALNRDGSLLVSGGTDQTFRVWDAATLQSVGTLQEQSGPIQTVIISPNGRLVVSGTRQGVIHLRRLADLDRARLLKGHRGAVKCLAITPDNAVLASAGSDGGIQLWSLPDGESLATLDGHDSPVLGLAVTPDGGQLLSTGADSTIRFWSLPDGKRLRVLHGHRATEQADAVHSLAVSPDGSLCASGGSDGQVRLWDLPGGGARKTIKAHRASVEAVAISPNGKLVASGGADFVVRLWRLPDGKLVRALEGHVSDVTSLAFSPDGRFLASASGGGWGQDYAPRIWDLDAKNAPPRPLDGHSRYVTQLLWSPTSERLFSASGDHTVRVWAADLARLAEVPVGKTTRDDLAAADAARASVNLSEAEQHAWTFLAALIRWRRRLDVVVEDAGPRVLEVGAFDIEIEG